MNKRKTIAKLRERHDKAKASYLADQTDLAKYRARRSRIRSDIRKAGGDPDDLAPLGDPKADIHPLVALDSKGTTPVASSLAIAKVLERPHKNVLQSLDKLASGDVFSRLIYEQRRYVDSRGKEQREYLLSEQAVEFAMPRIGGRNRKGRGKELTAERARELLSYDPSTGELRWRVLRIGNTVGGLAGSINGQGYLQISIDGRPYRGHRVIWLMVHGRWPVEEIDHKNHVRNDNRLVNLRECTKAANGRNVTLQRRNKSGHPGVYQQSDTWRAVITINSRVVHLGVFNDKADAIRARKAAERRYGFHPNHGIAAGAELRDVTRL